MQETGKPYTSLLLKDKANENVLSQVSFRSAWLSFPPPLLPTDFLYTIPFSSYVYLTFLLQKIE